MKLSGSGPFGIPESLYNYILLTYTRAVLMACPDQAITMLRNRTAAGSSFVETPFALWIIIIGLIMPMICFGTIGLRYTFFLNAARQAAHAAAQAKSFQRDYPPDLSAQTTAQNVAKNACQAFSGVTLNTVQTSIVATPIQGGSPTTSSTKLTTAADPETNLYQIQVQLSGALNPLISIPGGVLGVTIPGLTSPYPITTSAQEVSENIQGLNQ